MLQRTNRALHAALEVGKVECSNSHETAFYSGKTRIHARDSIDLKQSRKPMHARARAKPVRRRKTG
jgi:hypothetical protein